MFLDTENQDKFPIRVKGSDSDTPSKRNGNYPLFNHYTLPHSHLDGTSVISGEDEESRRKNTDLMVLTRSALSRPFGRTSLPAHLAKRWVVEVSCAGFDEELRMCTYNVMVTKEDYGATSATGSNSSSRLGHMLTISSSFPTASVDRTLLDFLWLEQSLQEEYKNPLESVDKP